MLRQCGLSSLGIISWIHNSFKQIYHDSVPLSDYVRLAFEGVAFEEEVCGKYVWSVVQSTQYVMVFNITIFPREFSM